LPLAAVLACALGALFLVGVAGAANSQSFTDRAGDAGLALDVTRLDVSNDDAGTVTFRVTVAGDIPIGAPKEQLGVALDLDQNPDTGTVYYGTEDVILFDGDQLRFGRADGAGFSAATLPASLQGSIGDDVATFSVKAADLGLAPNGGFNVFAIGETDVTGDADTAPDIRTFNYELVAGTPPQKPGPDARAPLDRAFASRGVHGRVARLYYWTADGRGVTADTVRVYRRGRLLKTIRISLGDASPFFDYYAPWRVPRTIRGRLRFCVRSRDAAGNRSNLSCAPLVIR
jgi:hypothetical protein